MSSASEIYSAVKAHYSAACSNRTFTGTYESGVAKAFGYTAEELASIPQDANLGLSCGNPLALAALREGETVVDLGSGAGLDCFLAAQKVGPTGKVIGVDMNDDMLAKADSNNKKRHGGHDNVRFLKSPITQIKALEDNIVDCIISNCVINLVPDEHKPHAFREMNRLLRPGGRVAISDILIKQGVTLPPHLKSDMALLVGCIAGASRVGDYDMFLRDAGFVDIMIVDKRKDLNVYNSSATDVDDGDAGRSCCETGGAPAQSSRSCCGVAPGGQDLKNVDLNAYAGSYSIYAEAYSSRYGPAASQEALPPPPKPAESLFPTEVPASLEKDLKHEPYSNPAHEEIAHPIQSDGSKTACSGIDDSASTGPSEGVETVGTQDLDLVLSVPDEAPSKHRHLEPSPYEHHFDTYSLVQQLATGGAYTPDQAITLMKAIRHMLALNLMVAKDSLVSKSDIENEAYLFRAACSELRTTLQATRHSEILKQRSQRAQLLHESDLLSQKMTQDLSSMREELKGMFNDRKLGLAEEKRRLDGKIQDLNYTITVLLNSEAKSNVEGLRWILTRRAALAISLSACMILAALNYSGMKTREREEAERKRNKAKDQAKERFKLVFNVPLSGLEACKTAIFAAGAGRYPGPGNYTECCFTTMGTGQFRPGDKANPHIGTVGNLEYVESAKVETLCVGEDVVRKAVEGLKAYV
ncbi:hypothetical protein DV737_g5544, partial [Chaetothyriales sp. CBS 132003]